MPAWLTLAQSPLFRFAAALLVLGLLRLVLLSLWEMRTALRRAGDQRIPIARILRESFTWLIPVTRLHRARKGYSLASFTFHLGILAATPFLGNHIDILQANFGVAWPALVKPLLDFLTLLTIGSGSFLLLYRLYAASSRKLSSPLDYLLLALILSIFVSGYLAGQPWNPIPYNGLMLLHTFNGILLVVLAPFTKIAHCVLYPLIRVGTELAWHFPPQAGSDVVKALHGPEGRRV